MNTIMAAYSKTDRNHGAIGATGLHCIILWSHIK